MSTPIAAASSRYNYCVDNCRLSYYKVIIWLWYIYFLLISLFSVLRDARNGFLHCVVWSVSSSRGSVVSGLGQSSRSANRETKVLHNRGSPEDGLLAYTLACYSDCSDSTICKQAYIYIACVVSWFAMTDLRLTKDKSVLTCIHDQFSKHIPCLYNTLLFIMSR